MVRNTINTVGKFLAATLFLVGSNSAWSAHEKLLDPSFYHGAPFVGAQFAPRIDMSAVSLKYDDDKKFLSGSSNSNSTFTLYDPNFVPKTFTGRFVLGASITSNGNFKGGAFSFLSNDPYFGFGNSNWGNVFSGTLNAAGWSDSKNVIEFDTGNFSGWACTQDQGTWCTEAERLWFTNVDGFPSSGWKEDWSDKNVNGTAVVPVPAAVWLLGSGLLGLFGVAKRKKA